MLDLASTAHYPHPQACHPYSSRVLLTTCRQGDIPGTYRDPEKTAPKNLVDPERNDYSTSNNACFHSLVLPFLWSLEIPSPRAEAEVLALGECCWGGIEALGCEKQEIVALAKESLQSSQGAPMSVSGPLASAVAEACLRKPWGVAVPWREGCLTAAVAWIHLGLPCGCSSAFDRRLCDSCCSRCLSLKIMGCSSAFETRLCGLEVFTEI